MMILLLVIRLYFLQKEEKSGFKKTDGVLYSDANKVLYDRIKLDKNGFAYGFNEDSIDIYEDSPIGYQSLFY